MIIRRDIQQGTPEWLQARVGKISASRAGEIVTPKNLDASKGEAYLNSLVVERLLGARADEDPEMTAWMERGHKLEVEAREWYAMMADVDPEEVGGIESDDGLYWASPDFIVAETVGGEIKCCGAKAHVGFLRDPKSFDQYVRIQTQFGLWLTGWDLWVAVAYNPHPRLPSLIREIRPDPKVQAAFDNHVPAFAKRVAEAVLSIKAMEVVDDDNPFI